MSRREREMAGKTIASVERIGWREADGEHGEEYAVDDRWSASLRLRFTDGTSIVLESTYSHAGVDGEWE